MTAPLSGPLAHRVALGVTVVLLPFLFNGLYNPMLAAHPPLFWALDVASWILLPGSLFYLFFVQGWVDLRPLGLTLPPWTRQRFLRFTLACALATLALHASVVGMDAWGEHLLQTGVLARDYGATGFGYKQMIPAEGGVRILILAYLAASAGIVEEILYRGVLRQFFGDTRLEMARYVLISSLIFSAVHWEGGVTALITAFAAGVVQSLLFLRLRSLHPLMAAHVAVDVFSFS